MILRRAASPAAIAAGASFAILVVGFNALDLYRNLFYSLNRFDHFSYNAARLVCVLFLLQIQFALGRAPLALLRRRGIVFDLAPEEELTIAILCGSAIMRTAMLVLGFAGLYYWWVMAALGAVSAAAGWDRYVALWRSFAADCRGIASAGNVVERGAFALVSFALVLSVGEVAAEKLILPNGPTGTGDFYNHYFPYMQHVVAAHNLWPNEVWYHFFVSKALGEGFFADLTTGPLGVQVASCAMFLAGLLVLFCFVRRASGDAFIALAAAATAATAFIWTDDPTFGFWADFPKEHVITATLFFGCVWAAWRTASLSAENVRPWSGLVGMAFCGLILVRVEFAAVTVVILAAMAAWSAVARRRALMLACVAQIGFVAVATAFVLGLNYAVTGVAEVTPFRLFWALADQQKFSHWVSPFLMLLLQLGSSPDFGTVGLANGRALPSPAVFASILRFERAAPLAGPEGITFVVALLLAAFALLARKTRLPSALPFATAVFIFVLGASAIAIFANDQLVSMYRLYVFCLFPVIALAALPFAIARSGFRAPVASILAVVVALQVFVAVPREAAAVQVQTLVEQFAVGDVSIADAFVREGALWPDGVAMGRAAGGAAIWSSQVGYYCAAPECNFETFFSFSMGPEWPTIMFGSADDAQAALRRLRLDFFAVNTNVGFFDLLPYAPLFSPAELKRRFGLAWSGDGVYLLTWRSAATQPIPDEFFRGLAASKALGLRDADFAAMYADLDSVYRQWKSDGERWPVRLNPALPLPRGWQ